MQIEINGKRNITLDFNAPKNFRLIQNGVEIPYIRTGKNSFRLSKNIDGSVEMEEVKEKPRYMKSFNLQAPQMTFISSEDVSRLNEAVRQMSLVNPEDVMAINNAADKIDSSQMYLAEKQQQIEATQNYIDQQQQRLNESALNIQALETNNSQRLDNAETAFYRLAGEVENTKSAVIDGLNATLGKIDKQGIILQAEIDTKADKEELESLKKDIEEKSDRFSSAMANYSGGTAYDTLPQGGEAGQILAKRTDRQGDYIWIDQTPVIVKSETIPTASEKYKGEVYQYVGETGEYTHGYIYECQQNGTSYEWVRLDVQPNTAVWGQITGTLSDQIDLQEALDDKQDKLTQTQMDAVNSGANQSNIAQITTNQTNINTINSKIPAQASSSNQLADKEFVNSSISTNTAYFIGTFNSVAELEAYSGTLTNNDYAFVIRTDVQGNTVYDRYKYTDATTPASWVFEYTLNNSSFTASQWQSINSGITDDLVGEFKAKGALLDYANDVLSLEDSEGNVLSSVTIQASAAADGKSITKNASDELQAIGVINQNNTTTAIKTWTGTKAQYDAIVTKDANTEYFCTDNGELYLGDVKIGSGACGLEIGDIGFAPLGIDETQNKRRYLNGQVISQAQFVSFTNKIKSVIQLHPSLATSETNWQAEVTNSKLGQCGKFVVDDTAGTIRLPKVVNIQGLQDLALMGSIKAESLPNITGSFRGGNGISDTNESGAFYDQGSRGDSKSYGAEAGREFYEINFGFNASHSSASYQDNAPVQQEAVQYPYFIQVATGVEESIDVTREIELNNPFSLLDYKWSEYALSNASWLLSNGAFHSGATYVAVYELLLKIKNGTETKDGVSVKLSTEAYTDTDFVINTANTTFRLPIKVKLASGNRVAGNGMTLGLTDGTNNYGFVGANSNGNNAWTGLYGSSAGSSQNNTGKATLNTLGVTTDPTKSGIETSSSGLKLYFYVGETIQDANVIAASQVLTDVADLKAHTIIDTYSDNNGNWYRVYSDGWIEQGSTTDAFSQGSSKTVTLLKPMADTFYAISFSEQCSYVASGQANTVISAKNTAGFTISRGGAVSAPVTWYVCGQGA